MRKYFLKRINEIKNTSGTPRKFIGYFRVCLNGCYKGELFKDIRGLYYVGRISLVLKNSGEKMAVNYIYVGKCKECGKITIEITNDADRGYGDPAGEYCDYCDKKHTTLWNKISLPELLDLLKKTFPKADMKGL